MLHRLFLLLSLIAAVGVGACAPEGEIADDADDPVIVADEQDVVGAGRRVCTWNVRRLGNNFNNEPKNIDATAKVIRENCDLVALTEVMVTIAAAGSDHRGFDELLAKLGSRYWAGSISAHPVPNPPTSSSEFYAFIWRKSAVSECEGWTGVQTLSDPEDVFIREPAWGCFKLRAHAHELVLGAYHALFGSLPERKREVGFLDDDLDRDGTADELFEAMKASRPGDPDVLLLGDFNLKPNELAEVLPRYVDLTTNTGSTINQSNEITNNQYDHALVPPGARLLAATKPAETLDVRGVVAGNKFYTSVSDHLPIRVILK
ncbi:MAG: endonuclease/exonuclease/phosphatase family protein [Labilithrix sp.]|nr:endonuclease/exonuclease/phosphatase family protein [Labilithrix sp.]MCW5810061.1 endonuclease/exonuclease/phosphatase family protein [Labilithrix sp.]